MSEKMDYFESLHDIRWKDKRKKILARDNYTCQRCKKENCYLEVHHVAYRGNLMAWEYKENELMSLCQDCHQDLSIKIKKAKNIAGYILHKREFENDADFLFELLEKMDGDQFSAITQIASDFIYEPHKWHIPRRVEFKQVSDSINNKEEEY